jgi:hypothetical protein
MSDKPSILKTGMIKPGGPPTEPVIKRGGRGYDDVPRWTLEDVLGTVLGSILGLSILYILVKVFG